MIVNQEAVEAYLDVILGACPRIENLLRKSPFGQIHRSFSLNRATFRLK
jgi:hypothetical protein